MPESELQAYAAVTGAPPLVHDGGRWFVLVDPDTAFAVDARALQDAGGEAVYLDQPDGSGTLAFNFPPDSPVLRQADRSLAPLVGGRAVIALDGKAHAAPQLLASDLGYLAVPTGMGFEEAAAVLERHGIELERSAGL